MQLGKWLENERRRKDKKSMAELSVNIGHALASLEWELMQRLGSEEKIPPHAQKQWGRIETIMSSPFFRVDVMHINSCGWTSIHRHDYFRQIVAPISGMIQVKYFDEGENGIEPVDSYDLLEPGFATQIPRKQLHCIGSTSNTGAIAVEVMYLPLETANRPRDYPTHNDIVRMLSLEEFRNL